MVIIELKYIRSNEMDCEPVVYEDDYYYCGNCLTELEWSATECEHCCSLDIRHEYKEELINICKTN